MIAEMLEDISQDLISLLIVCCSVPLQEKVSQINTHGFGVVLCLLDVILESFFEFFSFCDNCFVFSIIIESLNTICFKQMKPF